MAALNRLFLDCEWADVFGRELVSIGLVSLDGKQHFYAEREELPEPTTWVKQVVYPRLERGSSALPNLEMSRAIGRFLGALENPCICYDASKDKDLCIDLLMWSQPGSLAIDRLRWHMLSDTGEALERWWANHPSKRTMRHHALTDAKALRAAWLSLWGV